MKNILITGGAGFIGSYLSLQLQKEGYKVTVMDNLSPQVHGENSYLYEMIKENVHFIHGDVRVKADWEHAIQNQDLIIHLAAETGTGQSMYEIQKYQQVNNMGTSLLIDVLVNHPHQVKKIILASSRAVYGEGKYLLNGQYYYPNSRKTEDLQAGNFNLTHHGQILQPLPTDEDALLHPISFYGLTKLHQEDIIKFACNTLGIEYAILRFQNVYGVGQSLQNPYTGILSIFSNQILFENSINVFEDGGATRDFIEVNDAVTAISKSIKLVKDDIVNVGTGIPTSILQIAEKLNSLFGKNKDINISGNFRKGDIRYNVADTTKMEKLLQFTPTISLDEGLKKWVNWVSTQEITSSHFQQSILEMKEKGLLLQA